MRALFRRLCALFCAAVMLITSAAALSVEDARKLLEEEFVDPLPESAYSAQTLDDLFRALGDPYTYYMTAEEYTDFLSGLENESSVVGVGATVLFTQDGILISSVLDGGSAKEAGLKKDDLIIAVDGVSCVPGTNSNGIVGQAGTYVTLTVRHSDGSVKDYRLQRRLIEIHNTMVSFENGVGYIDCSSFGSETGAYFADGITKYDSKAHIWVVDLRDNSGGISTSAVSAAGAFCGSGALLYFRDSSDEYYYNAHFEDYLTEDPVIVLTNSASASACEVFSAAIRDKNAGIIVGSRTFGKGVAQSIFDKETHSQYFDGDALKATVYRFFSANGNTNDRIGVLPTLLVADEQAEAVVELLSTKEPSRPDGHLRLTLGGWYFYVNLKQAESDAYRDAFHELLAALPPDAPVELGSGSNWGKVGAAMVSTLYGDESRSRLFTDVSESKYADAINTLGVYGILNGTGDGAFDPTGTLTRAQLCALLAQALDISASTENHFTDVPSDRWYADSINAMAEMGLVTGVGAGHFDPLRYVTQQEYITIMGRLAAFLNFYGYEYQKDLIHGSLAIDDRFAPFAPWARESAAVLTGMLQTSDGQPIHLLHAPLEEITPTALILREEAAATLHKLLTQLRIIAY